MNTAEKYVEVYAKLRETLNMSDAIKELYAQFQLDNKQVGADVLEKSMNAVSQLSNEDIADAYNQVKDIQFEGMTVDEYFSQPISFSEDEIEKMALIAANERFPQKELHEHTNTAYDFYKKGANAILAALQQKSTDKK